jgi:hypothetical protein
MIDLITKSEVAHLQPRTAPEEVGMFKGFGTALVQGPEHGIDVARASLIEALGPPVQGMLGAVGIDVKEVIEDNRQIARQFVRDSRPDPYRTGAASNVVHSLGAIIAEAGVAAATGGTVGAAVALGGMTAYDKYQEMIDQGIDPATATMGAGVSGVTMGVGAGLPAFIGTKLATQIASGVGINMGLGMVERGATSKALADAGYEAQAANHRVFDGEAMVTEAILGAVFPIGARALFGKKPTQTEIDTALELEKKKAIETRDPGLPKDEARLTEFEEGQIDVSMQLMEGKSAAEIVTPKVIDDVPNPEFGAAVRATDEAIDEVVLQETGKTIEQHRVELEEVKATQQEVNAEIQKRLEEEPPKEGEVPKPPPEEVTPESIARSEAMRVIETNPDIKVAAEDGTIVSAKEMLDRADLEVKRINEDAKLHEVAIACAISLGS